MYVKQHELSLFHAQTQPSHKEKGLVTIERFLGYAESAVLIVDKPMNVIQAFT